VCCTPRGGPRVRCCCARPTCTRPGPALQQSAAGRSAVLAAAAVGDCSTQGANRHGGHWQTGRYRAAGARILPSPVNAGPGPWCSTPPAKWQGPPAGLGAAGSGEPRAAGRVRPLPCMALEGALPAGAIQRHASGRAQLGQPGRCDRAGQVQPAATLLRRWRFGSPPYHTEWQGPPAGLGAAGSGEPRAAGRVRPCQCLAGRCKAPYRPGPFQRHGRVRLGQPGRCDRAGQVQRAATLLRRWRWISDHRHTIILLPRPSSWLQCRLTCPAAGISRVKPLPALPVRLVRTRLNCAARAASVSVP
jgi:hypothetical protein